MSHLWATSTFEIKWKLVLCSIRIVLMKFHSISISRDFAHTSTHLHFIIESHICQHLSILSTFHVCKRFYKLAIKNLFNIRKREPHMSVWMDFTTQFDLIMDQMVFRMCENYFKCHLLLLTDTHTRINSFFSTLQSPLTPIGLLTLECSSISTRKNGYTIIVNMQFD